MAIIHCPECAREISDRATACPGCGCPLQSSAPPASEGTGAAPRDTVGVVGKIAAFVFGIFAVPWAARALVGVVAIIALFLFLARGR